MEQLSRPYKIGLGVMVVLALAWFLVLKPSEAAVVPAAAPTATAPGAAGLGAAVDKAEGAAGAAAARNADPQAAVPAGAGAVARAARTRKAKARKAAVVAAKPSADPSAAVLSDLDDGKVAVLLFYSPQSTDDRAVRRALTAADRHGGKVIVRTAPIAKVADYSAITEGVDILQAPTLLVVGKEKLARTIVGYTDTLAIDQLVADVGGPKFAKRRSRG